MVPWKPIGLIVLGVAGIFVAQVPPIDGTGWMGNLTAIGFLGTGLMWILIKTLPHILDKIGELAKSHKESTEAITTNFQEGIKHVCARRDSDAARLEAARDDSDAKFAELRREMQTLGHRVEMSVEDMKRHCAVFQARRQREAEAAQQKHEADLRSAGELPET